MSIAPALLLGTAMAGGPAQVAMMDRASLSISLHTPDGFDRASRLEILAYAQVLLADAGAQRPRSEPGRVARWKLRTLEALWVNYQRALEGCARPADLVCNHRPRSFTRFLDLARQFDRKLPPEAAGWYEIAHPFHVAYFAEQRRLAVLFPETSSEIGKFDPREISGLELPDKTFQISFDDGPSEASGDTDADIAWLRQHHLHALFFLLGDALAARADAVGAGGLRMTYEEQCPASHGAVHKSHAAATDWQMSISSTLRSLQHFFPNIPSVKLFRPPYGERLPQAERYVETFGGRVVLWNLDSEDWNSLMEIPRISDRLITLMLVWRRGIVLFHDTHPGARIALPQILDATDGSGVVWQDCRDFP